MPTSSSRAVSWRPGASTSRRMRSCRGAWQCAFDSRLWQHAPYVRARHVRRVVGSTVRSAAHATQGGVLASALLASGACPPNTSTQPLSQPAQARPHARQPTADGHGLRAALQQSVAWVSYSWLLKTMPRPPPPLDLVAAWPGTGVYTWARALCCRNNATGVQRATGSFLR